MLKTSIMLFLFFFSRSFAGCFLIFRKKSAKTQDMIRQTCNWHTENSTNNQLQHDLPKWFPLAWSCSSILSSLTPEGSIPRVSLCNTFLAYYSPQSIPEVSHNSLLISLFSCRIRGRVHTGIRQSGLENDFINRIVLIAWNLWLCQYIKM